MPVRDVRQEFITHSAKGEAAALLWDQLEAYDVRCMYQEWFARAYEDQAVTNRARIWLELQESLYNALAPKLRELGIDSWDDDSWRFLVPFIGGGWLMTKEQPRSHVHPLIQEEP